MDILIHPDRVKKYSARVLKYLAKEIEAEKCRTNMLSMDTPVDSVFLSDVVTDHAYNGKVLITLELLPLSAEEFSKIVPKLRKLMFSAAKEK